MSSLFREAVLKKRFHNSLGEPLYSTKKSWFFISLLYFVLFFGGILFLSLATYSRSQTVTGKLTFSQGMFLVIPNKQGIISHVFVNDGMKVKQGSLLISVSTAQYRKDGQSIEQLTKRNLENQLNLYKQRVTLLSHTTQTQVQALTLITKNLSKKLLNAQSEIAIQKRIIGIENNKEKQFRHLLKNGAISAEKMATQEKVLRNAQINIKALMIQQESLQNDINENQYKTLQLRNALAENKNDLASKIATIKQSILSIDSQNSYTVTSPINGTVTALKAHLGDTVNTTDTVMAVIPNHSTLQAQLSVSNRSIGLIHKGDKVKLKLDAFPYQRFGTVAATITSISFVPTVDNTRQNAQKDYLVQAKLEKSTISVYGNQTPLQSGMSFSANIITQKQSIIAWLFDPIFAVWKS